MIKLKALINEIQNNPTLSKMEEEYAFKVLLTKLLPTLVESYNVWIDHKNEIERIKKKTYGGSYGFSKRKQFFKTDLKEMAYNIKKISREPNKIEYNCVLKSGHIRFLIIKEINPLENLEEIEIGVDGPNDVGWNGQFIWHFLKNLRK